MQVSNVQSIHCQPSPAFTPAPTTYDSHPSPVPGWQNKASRYLPRCAHPTLLSTLPSAILLPSHRHPAYHPHHRPRPSESYLGCCSMLGSPSNSTLTSMRWPYYWFVLALSHALLRAPAASHIFPPPLTRSPIPVLVTCSSTPNQLGSPCAPSLSDICRFGQVQSSTQGFLEPHPATQRPTLLPRDSSLPRRPSRSFLFLSSLSRLVAA
ncbi:hypothetical protein B0I35DRAFT_133978 [Stachybotrys elegans]|uniref:Uncharacterized protein n=1 Tax=Stachybotrys elegans TaxID=80388 RepID=A0A8K0WX00_9HYPO|nr:hypothetical protein B0I35DRAFT_133978 [Stachybotrys elegans]